MSRNRNRLLLRTLAGLSAGACLASVGQAQTPLYEHDGAGQYDRLGVSTAGIADVNADGSPDYLVGATENFQAILAQPGYVRLYSGKTGALIRTWNGNVNGEEFGHAVDSAGRVNGDSVPDVIVGVPGDSSLGTRRGSARVYDGANGALLYQFDGAGNGDECGWAVSSAGDVNNDGRDDLIVGARSANANGSNSGAAYIYSGLNGTLLREYKGSANGKFLGASVDGMGDLNGDGFDEVLVGSYFDGVKVYSGLTGLVLLTFPNTGPNDYYGWATCRLDDVTGDGVDDILIGATQDAPLSPDKGFAQVRNGATGALVYTLNGDAVGDRFGVSVAGLGDWDGDGTPDFAVGADQSQNGAQGYVKVFSGATGGVLHTFTGQAGLTRLGTSVAGLGDVNGDFRTEISLGEPGASPNGLSSGELHVVSSNSGGPACPPPATYCVTAPNSVGNGALISSTGSTSISANNLILLATGCPTNQFGVFFYGPNQIQFPFGDGFRCVGAGGASVFRLPTINTGPAGLAAYAVNYNNLPLGGDLHPFDVTNFQFWYRDPGFGNFGFNLSNALHVEFCP